MIIAGIDPGKSGAIVVLQDGALVKWGLLKTIVPKYFLQENGVKVVWIEKAQVMGRESARAMFSYGRDYGYMIGTLTGCGFDINYVPPAVWTGVLHKKTPLTFDNPKAASLYVARQIWPQMDWRASPQSRVPHDGIVDAALIAYYGWIKGEPTLSMKTYPLDDCFKLAFEMFNLFNANKRIPIYLCHGVCQDDTPIAWVEREARCYGAGNKDGKSWGWDLPYQEFYDQFKIKKEKIRKYSQGDVLALSLLVSDFNNYGPWNNPEELK